MFRTPAESPQDRLWMVGLRYRDGSRRLVRHYYLVTAAGPDQAVDAGRLRSGSAVERRRRADAPLDGTWCEVKEVVSDATGSRPFALKGAACEGACH